jgi:hypothetical protein
LTTTGARATVGIDVRHEPRILERDPLPAATLEIATGADAPALAALRGERPE